MQPLHTDSWHIEDVHLLICVALILFFSYTFLLNLDNFYTHNT